MNLTAALHHDARREEPEALGRQLALAVGRSGRATTARERRNARRCERALRERLALAEALRDYDWEAGEAEFAVFVRRAAGVPGAYERWRAHGVPIRVLLRAGLRPTR